MITISEIEFISLTESSRELVKASHAASGVTKPTMAKLAQELDDRLWRLKTREALKIAAVPEPISNRAL